MAAPGRYRQSGSKGVVGTMDLIAAAEKGVAPKEHLPASRTNKRKSGINLKAVSEVLAARGLDPTEEIIDILDATDDKGRPLIDPEIRLRVLNELLQYTQPKLKSVEVRGKLVGTSFDINDEQAKKIAEEFLRMSGDIT